MKITDASVEYSTTVWVLLFILILGGSGAYMGLPREAAPEIEIPVILVTVPYPGVSPADIESLVTQPIEKEVAEIKDIDELTSTSAEGAAIITVKFTPDANLDESLQEVREKVDLAVPKLPKDAESPVIQAISTADFPMMIVNVTGPYSIIRLRDVAEDLQDDIEKVQGVLDVKLAGGLEREIQVRVDPMRLNHFGLALRDISDALSQENINMPGGNIKVGDASFLIRVPGEYKDMESISDTIIKIRGGNPVYIRDVAEVKDSFKDRGNASRLDGLNNISLTITKRPGENLPRVAADIKKHIAEYEKKSPPTTRFVILSDESVKIQDLVKELENTMLSGLLLVIIVIFFAMGLRNSILVGLAIPMSMLVTFLALSAMGITLNMIVLFSLILALGMLVDNAIVIVENIYRHASEGKSRIAAAIEGTREVAWPVTTSTITTIAAFAPLLFWPDVVGKFMGYLPKTLIITLSASLFVALIITPVLAAVFIQPQPKKVSSNDGNGSDYKERFMTGYQNVLNWSIFNRWKTMGIGGLAFVITIVIFAASGLGVEFFPEVTPKKIMIDVDTGAGSRLELSDQRVRSIEKELARHENIKHYVANVGSGSGMAFLGASASVANKSQISVDFVDEDDQKTPIPDTISALRAMLGELPGARIELKKEAMGPPTGAPVEIEIYGDDFKVLGELAQKIRNEIRGIDGLVDLHDDYVSGRPELRIEVDKERAKLVRASTGQIAGTIRTAINGTKASSYREGDEEYDITVRLDEKYRSSLADVEALRINVSSRTNPNITYQIPIGEIADLVSSGGTGSIRHKELNRVVTVKGNNSGRQATAVLEDVREKLSTFELPEGYYLDYAGEEKDRKKSQAFLSKAFLIALFGIALILVTQFNSIVLPTIIMIAVQMSFLGVLWGQIITRMPFGIIMTGLGVISLAGVVVNNGIVLVDYIQILRKRGLPRDEALIQAGIIRLRPVLLTAITTILGLMPMAFGVSIDFSSFSIQAGGQMSEFWKPMAVAVIFGLLIATVLTLVVVPVLYSLFDDLEGWVRGVFSQ